MRGQSDPTDQEAGRGIPGAALRLTEGVIAWGALIAGYALLFQAAITAFEIIARKLFSFSMQGVDEYGGYVLAITASLGFGYAAMTRAHTRVDVVLRLLAPSMRGVLHVAAQLILMAVAIAMLWYAYSALTETRLYGSVANSPLETPLWIPQTLWLAGFALFALVATLLAWRAAMLLWRRDVALLDAEYGPPTLEEELADLEDRPADRSQTHG
jgi:TRAP-type C4-dicarboxylate transport system permease small subunit